MVTSNAYPNIFTLIQIVGLKFIIDLFDHNMANQDLLDHNIHKAGSRNKNHVMDVDSLVRIETFCWIASYQVLS